MNTHYDPRAMGNWSKLRKRGRPSDTGGFSFRRGTRIHWPGRGTGSPRTSEDLPIMIPKVIHQIWLGPNRIPDHFFPWMETWRRCFSDWEYKLWTDADLPGLLGDCICRDILSSDQNVGLRSDVLRLELLRLFGGIYADCDFECLVPFDHLFQSACFHYGDELQGRPSNAWMCSSAGHDVPRLMLEQMRESVTQRIDTEADWTIVVRKTGPEALARALNFWVGDWKGETLFHRGMGVGVVYPGRVVSIWREILYPYSYGDHLWTAFSRNRYPHAMAAHHWGGSWK